MAETTKDFANTAKLALAKVILMEMVNEPRYPCLCGEPPYEDGEPCPNCAAIRFLEFEEKAVTP